MKNFVKNLSDGGLAEDVYAAMERILDEDTNKEKMVNKQEFIEKAKKWLEKTLFIHTEIEEDKDWGITTSINWVTTDDYESVEDFINGFCKAMEE